MADEAKLGTIWQTDELDAIVEDYFMMLTQSYRADRMSSRVTVPP